MVTATLTALLVLGVRRLSSKSSGLVVPGPALSERTGPLFDATALDLPPTLTAAATAVSTSGLRSVVRPDPERRAKVLLPGAVRLRFVAEAKASLPMLIAVAVEFWRRPAWVWRGSDADADPGRPVTTTRPRAASPQKAEC
jgi:hypothetical protein